MENKRISDLPAVENIKDTALLAAEQDGVAVKITAGQLLEYASAGLPNGDEVSY